MKKVFLSLAVVAMATLTATAQKDSKSDSQVKLDVGVSAGLPIGDFGDESSFGIGGYAKGSYKVADNIDLTLTGDYKSFTGKTIDGFKIPSAGLLTFLGGATYNMDGGFHVDGGIGFGSESVKFDDGNGGTVSGTASGFAYRFGIGYTVSEVLDITANYNGVSVTGGSLGYIGFGVGYRFVK